MDTHRNAPLTPKGREMMVRAVVDCGLTKTAAARKFNTTPKTAAKWIARFAAEGVDGLRDRSSRPLSSPSQATPAICSAVESLRRQRHTHHIKKLGRIGAIGHRITGRRTGVVNRHLGIGWEFVHVCIDDASRVAFSQIMKDERKESAVAFLETAAAYYLSLGVKVERVMTDNGSCYLSQAFRQACQRLALKHVRTKPYTPRTNGKAERFIQTSLREWAYAESYNSSAERTAELPRWLHRYNWHRPHASIGAKPPISRLDLAEDNLLRLHS